ncbi:GLIPR1-like protein 1 [Saccostrea cucullata]|uniref:GLIPR1-like protein 1 n=1 Tax=Saccostrea cuccullata TaxID=36930 RepID=UPI002ED112F1
MAAVFVFLILGFIIEVQPLERHEFLKAHNLARRFENAANMKEMKWSDELASLAQTWASACIRGHNRNRKTRHFRKIGENIHRSTRQKTGYEAVASWCKEKAFYDFDEDSCTGVCGHYTQAVWADSEYIGCAEAFCPAFFRGRGGYNYVCNYGPRGNWRGRKPYIPGQQCSQCPKGYKCHGGLCAEEDS